jgi:hypothetical protein
LLSVIRVQSVFHPWPKTVVQYILIEKAPDARFFLSRCAAAAAAD